MEDKTSVVSIEKFKITLKNVHKIQRELACIYYEWRSCMNYFKSKYRYEVINKEELNMLVKLKDRLRTNVRNIDDYNKVLTDILKGPSDSIKGKKAVEYLKQKEIDSANFYNRLDEFVEIIRRYNYKQKMLALYENNYQRAASALRVLGKSGYLAEEEVQTFLSMKESIPVIVNKKMYYDHLYILEQEDENNNVGKIIQFMEKPFLVINDEDDELTIQRPNVIKRVSKNEVKVLY